MLPFSGPGFLYFMYNIWQDAGILTVLYLIILKLTKVLKKLLWLRRVISLHRGVWLSGVLEALVLL